MKRPAIVVDLDGTLCNNSHRQHLYDEEHMNWKLINEESKYDVVNDWCMEIVSLFAMNGYKIIFLTGRSMHAWDVTHEWLTRNVGMGVDWTLLMRKKDDNRPDTLSKTEIYCKEVAPLYNTLFAIDDRTSVVHMWRNLGITCLACAENH